MHHSFSQFETPYLCSWCLKITSRRFSPDLFRHWKPFNLAVFLHSHPDTPFPFQSFQRIDPSSSLSTSSKLHTLSQWLSVCHLTTQAKIPDLIHKSKLSTYQILSQKLELKPVSSPSHSCHLPLLSQHWSFSCSFNLLKLRPYITKQLQ